MTDIALDWIKENAPSLFAAAVAAIAAWRFGLIYHKFNRRLEGYDENGEALKGIQRSVSQLNDKAEHLQNQQGAQAKLLDRLQTNINDLISTLGEKDPEIYKVLIMKKSPLQLSPNGEKIFNAVDGQRFLDENREFLLGKIEEQKPRTALDVESLARRVCVEQLDTPIFDRIKNVVFNHPAIELVEADGKKTDYAFTIADVCFVLSFPLRNLYLDLHPELLQDQDSKE